MTSERAVAEAHGWISYDTEERWLVETDRVGEASRIVGRDVEQWVADLVFAALAATPAPRENGWDELRREIEALGARYSGWLPVAAVLAIVDRFAASPSPAPPEGLHDEFAWLIERGQPEKQVPTVWWADRKRWGLAHMDEWTEDANKAYWFASKAEAEDYIERHSPIPSHRPRLGRAVEHGFLASPAPDPGAGLDAAWAEAEAAATKWAEGKRTWSVGVFRQLDSAEYSANAEWYAHREPNGPPSETGSDEADGPTAAAALTKLAHRLAPSAEPPETET